MCFASTPDPVAPPPAPPPAPLPAAQAPLTIKSKKKKKASGGVVNDLRIPSPDGGPLNLPS